jgi:hypothetical protein
MTNTSIADLARSRHDIMYDAGFYSSGLDSYELGSSILERFVNNDPDIVLVEGSEEKIRKPLMAWYPYPSNPTLPSWYTSHKCMSVQLVNNLVQIDVWDGDLNGGPSNLRYEVVFKMNWWELSEFRDLVDRDWNAFVEQKLAEEDEELRRIRHEAKSLSLTSKESK